MSLFFTQLRLELLKLFARKRTWIGFVVFLALEVLILALLQLPKVQRSWQRLIERSGYVFEDYFSGITLAFQIVFWTMFLLGGLYVALVAGDIVSKEVEDGTLRMTLCRPVSRLRVLLTKYLASLIFTFALVVFVGVSALIVGTLKEGVGGFFVFQPIQRLFAMYEFQPGLVRYLASLPILALSLASLTSLAFALSCLNMKPAAATICALSYFIADMIFKGIPYFEDIQHWFITTHTDSWYNIFRSPIPWETMIMDYAYLFGVNVTLVVIGIAVFVRRDFKS